MDPMQSQDELNQAGAVIDKAIAFLLDKKLPPVAVASALLGGALGLLAREMSDEFDPARARQRRPRRAQRRPPPAQREPEFRAQIIRVPRWP